MPPDYDLLAETGAAWADLHYPGWLPRIDLATADVGDYRRCPLVQITRTATFSAAVKAARARDPLVRVTELGFGLIITGPASEATTDDLRAGYQALTHAWRRIVLQRRAQATIPEPAHHDREAGDAIRLVPV